ncbi:restriction endonuclease subunit S [Cyanobium sp. FGCU-52]|nr:restriction endonuclease subunit S [Cyanobium sp. FGCU52]
MEGIGEHAPPEATDASCRWPVVSLDEVCSITSGITKGRKLPAEPSREVPYMAVANVQDGRLNLNGVKTIQASLSEIERYRLVRGDLLLTEGGDPDKLGRGAVWNGEIDECIHQNHIFRVRAASPLIDMSYLSRLVASPAGKAYFLSQAKQTTGIASINLTQLRGFPVPLPPLGEQLSIAAKLDTTLAAVDACRQRLDGVEALLKRFRQAVLASATSGELTREWREERGTDWSPHQLTLGDLGAIITGNTPKVVSDDKQGIVPLFKPTELDDGYHVWHAKELMGPKRAQGARMLPPLSVLVTCIGATIGKTGLSRIAGATNQQINAIVCDPKIAIPEWAFFWFTSPVGQASIIANSSATTLPIINKSRFSALELDVPGVEEQGEIVQLVESLFSLADQLEAKLTDARKLVERLTPALLAKAFRGELVPQDPNDEPASVLLERIRAARQAEAAAGKTPRRGRRKAAANPDQLPLAAAPVPTDLLSSLLRECGALSERALLAASELDPDRFQVQLAMERKAGAIRDIQGDGQRLLEAVG